MSDAMTTNKKKIETTEFTAGDFSKSQRSMLITSIVLIVLSCVLQAVAQGSYRYATEVRGAAQQALVVAKLAEEGVGRLGNGGGGSLRAAINSLDSASDAMLSVNAGGLRSALGTLGGEFDLLQQGYFDFRAAMQKLSDRHAAAEVFSQALGAQYSALDALQKRLVDGRASSKAVDSVARLAAYAESGVTPFTALRAEFDVRNAAFELQSTEYRGVWSQIERAIATPARAAAAAPVTQEEIATLAAAAQRTRSKADQVAASAANGSAGTVISFISVLMGLAGVWMLIKGARTVAADYNRRFQRAISQFHGTEETLERVQGGLKSVLDGRLQSKAPDRTDELASFQRMLNEVMDRIRFTIGEVKSIHEVSTESRAAIKGMSQSLDIALAATAQLSQEIGSFGLEIINNDIDARAAMFASTAAAERAGESDQVIREAVSRMEAMREGLQDASKNVKRVGERGLEIAEAVDSFSQISEQIGVLSLNAALEAERAGEMGKGFRVVAAEVRALSRRSEEAVEKMLKLVQGAQADARSAQQAVDRSTTQIVSGSHVGVVANSLTASAATVLARVQSLTRAISAGGQRVRASAIRVQQGLEGVVVQVQGSAKETGVLETHAKSIEASADAASKRFARVGGAG